MMDTKRIWIIIGVITVVIISAVIVISLAHDKKELAEDQALDDYYDDYYGYARDNVMLNFEQLKPSYYDHIDFSSVYFPIDEESAYYFPAFVMFETMQYATIPEEAMRNYLPDWYVEQKLILERDGWTYEGIHNEWEPLKPPTYLDIGVYKYDDNYYKVIVVTDFLVNTYHFLVEDGKIVEQLKGGY